MSDRFLPAIPTGGQSGVAILSGYQRDEIPALVRKPTYSFVARVRGCQVAMPTALERAGRRSVPPAKQPRVAQGLRRYGAAGRLIVVARPESRRVAAECALEISALLVSLEIVLCEFCEHRSPPSADQPDSSGSDR